jgi:EF hand domain-containing protein
MKLLRQPLVFAVAALVCQFTPAAGAAQVTGFAQREAAREQARFRAMDADADGVITRAEWHGNARGFARYDTNHDGVLSGSEVWIGGSRTATPNSEDQRQQELFASFFRADRDRDGRLDRSEWSNDDVAFNRADRNRDGYLSEREYLTTPAAAAPVGTTGDQRRDTPGYKSGYERGLVEGRQAGKEDKELRNKWDLEGQRELEQADSGYTTQLGSREDYQAGYRAGFRLGYAQGFGPR